MQMAGASKKSLKQLHGLSYQKWRIYKSAIFDRIVHAVV
jgi:hypothetical protein